MATGTKKKFASALLSGLRSGEVSNIVDAMEKSDDSVDSFRALEERARALEELVDRKIEERRRIREDREKHSNALRESEKLSLDLRTGTGGSYALGRRLPSDQGSETAPVRWCGADLRPPAEGPAHHLDDIAPMGSSSSRASAKLDGSDCVRVSGSRSGDPGHDDAFIFLEDALAKGCRPSEAEVAEYARVLGMDPVNDKDLFWIARDGLKAPVSWPWRPCLTHEEGEVFFFNFVTGERSRDHPNDERFRRLYLYEKARKFGVRVPPMLPEVSNPLPLPHIARSANGHATGSAACATLNEFIAQGEAVFKSNLPAGGARPAMIPATTTAPLVRDGIGANDSDRTRLGGHQGSRHSTEVGTAAGHQTKQHGSHGHSDGRSHHEHHREGEEHDAKGHKHHREGEEHSASSVDVRRSSAGHNAEEHHHHNHRHHSANSVDVRRSSAGHNAAEHHHHNQQSRPSEVASSRGGEHQNIPHHHGGAAVASANSKSTDAAMLRGGIAEAEAEGHQHHHHHHHDHSDSAEAVASRASVSAPKTACLPAPATYAAPHTNPVAFSSSPVSLAGVPSNADSGVDEPSEKPVYRPSVLCASAAARLTLYSKLTDPDESAVFAKPVYRASVVEATGATRRSLHAMAYGEPRDRSDGGGNDDDEEDEELDEAEIHKEEALAEVPHIREKPVYRSSVLCATAAARQQLYSKLTKANGASVPPRTSLGAGSPLQPQLLGAEDRQDPRPQLPSEVSDFEEGSLPINKPVYRASVLGAASIARHGLYAQAAGGVSAEEEHHDSDEEEEEADEPSRHPEKPVYRESVVLATSGAVRGLYTQAATTIPRESVFRAGSAARRDLYMQASSDGFIDSDSLETSLPIYRKSFRKSVLSASHMARQGLYTQASFPSFDPAPRKSKFCKVNEIAAVQALFHSKTLESDYRPSVLLASAATRSALYHSTAKKLGEEPPVAPEPTEEEKKMAKAKEGLHNKIESDLADPELALPCESLQVAGSELQVFGGLRFGERYTEPKRLMSRTELPAHSLDNADLAYAWDLPSKLHGVTHATVYSTKGRKSSPNMPDLMPNQDNFFVCQIGNISIYGVVDGHGPFGHLMTFRLAQSLPHFLCSSVHFGKDWQKAMHETFNSAEAELLEFCEAHDINTEASGAAGSLLVHDGLTIHVAHIGDAAILIGDWSKKGQHLISITEDHVPDLPEERARIEAAGMEVAEKDMCHGFRIYQPGTNFPGMAMSRAFGDTAGKGVIQDPAYSSFTMDPADQWFALLASDGVWEFIEPQSVLELTAKKLRVRGAHETVRYLVDTLARKRWEAMDEDYCDDISAVLVQWNKSDDGGTPNSWLTLRQPVSDLEDTSKIDLEDTF